jgi:hypothetical protein
VYIHEKGRKCRLKVGVQIRDGQIFSKAKTIWFSDQNIGRSLTLDLLILEICRSVSVSQSNWIHLFGTLMVEQWDVWRIFQRVQLPGWDHPHRVGGLLRRLSKKRFCHQVATSNTGSHREKKRDKIKSGCEHWLITGQWIWSLCPKVSSSSSNMYILAQTSPYFR